MVNISHMRITLIFILLIQQAMDITFSLKTFKIILNYSEAQSLDVNIHYDKYVHF